MTGTVTTSLGDLVSIVGGGTPSRDRPEYYHGEIPWITVKDLKDDLVLRSSQEAITQLGLKQSASRLVPRDSVIVATRMAPGKVMLNGIDVAINQDLKALLCGPHLNPWFLLFFLRWASPLLEAAASGSTVKGIVLKDLEDLEIRLPPLPEQQRIAGLLEKADLLGRIRRYALELSDTFLHAAFLEMFGDPAANEKKWVFASLHDFADIVSGATKGQRFGERTTVTVPYLRVANVQDGYLDLSEIKTIEALARDAERLRLLSGDVVLTEGGDFDKLGRGAVWEGGIEHCIHQNHIFRVRLDKTVALPEFFASFLQTTFTKRYFLLCSKQTTNLASINMSQLRETPVPLPPMERQKEFAKAIGRHRRLQAVHREALRQAEHLFQSLLHRAFSEDAEPLTGEALEVAAS